MTQGKIQFRKGLLLITLAALALSSKTNKSKKWCLHTLVRMLYLNNNYLMVS